jgi:hypothetical protein
MYRHYVQTLCTDIMYRHYVQTLCTGIMYIPKKPDLHFFDTYYVDGGSTEKKSKNFWFFLKRT